MAVSSSRYSYRGVEYTFIDTPVRLLEETKCPICHEIMKEPVSTSCDHLFCGNCIKDQPTCPTCRKRFTTTPDRGSVRIVKAFKVKCPNSVEGCKWQGDLGDAEEHLEEKCQHQKVNCPNGCEGRTKHEIEQLHPLSENTHLHPMLQNSQTRHPCPPWVVKLEGFEEKKRTEEYWMSTPIYSHLGGYKVCLCIYPHGVHDGQGTHTSLYISLMKGDNDDNLEFPFKGYIVVSLLNQLEDKNHRTTELWRPDHNFPEAVTSRVIIGERNKGWGSDQFIPHSDLLYDSNKTRQYLKNDCLFFRVDKIDVYP